MTTNGMINKATELGCKYVIETNYEISEYAFCKTKKEADAEFSKFSKRGLNPFILNIEDMPKDFYFEVVLMNDGDFSTLTKTKSCHAAIKSWMKAWIKNPTMIAINCDWNSKRDILNYARWNDCEVIHKLAESTKFAEKVDLSEFCKLVTNAKIGKRPKKDLEFDQVSPFCFGL